MKKILLLSYFIIATAITTTAQCWQDIATGGGHSIGIKTNGTLWAWGANSVGQLGDGTTINKLTAVQTGTASNWKSIACGGSHNLAIKTDGTLWTWGYNTNGQLGDGTTVNKLVPTQIGTATNWLVVSAGFNHSIAIKTDGTLWACGLNSTSQLGDGTAVDKNVFTQIGVATNWQSAIGGFDFTMAIQSDGTLWGFGSNSFKQLGDGTTITRTIPTQIGTANNWLVVACGQAHSVAIKTDGTLWSWGYNFEGALGSGATTQNATPIQIGVATNWKAVAANYRHSLATKTNGTLWGFGVNSLNELGDGTTVNRNIPTQIGVATNWLYPKAGGSQSMAIKNDATIWGWGNNSVGQLGDGTTVQRVMPTQAISACAVGAALNFDGVNDDVTIGSVIPSGSSYTKEAWIYANAAGTCNIISSNDAPFWLMGGKLSATHTSGGTTLQDPAVFTLNQWVHVAVTYDATSGIMKLYKNGSMVATSTQPTQAGMTISLGQYAGGNRFQGSMDEVRIWNVARTQCEINTYKNCEISTSAAGLLANYHFNQGIDAGNNTSITGLTDISGNSNIGTLNNFALTTGTVSNWVAPGGVVSGSVTPANLSITVGSTVTNSVICLGNSTTLSGTGANTYSWTNGVTNTAAFSPIVTNTYTVTGTNTITGCSNTAVSTVTVNALPTITVSSGAICAGDSYTIAANGALTYTSVPALVGPVVTPTATTNYSITGTDANGCTSSVAAVSSVTVNALPTITVLSGAICAGQSFTMVPSGATTYTYSNGTNVVMPTADATYSISGTDANGCTSSVAAVSSVTVNALPIISVNSGTICSGNSFTMIPSGASTYTYSNGSAIVSPTMNTSYSVTGTSADGCLSSNTAISNVMLFISDQVVTVTPATICAGSSTTVDVQSSEIGVSYTLRDNTTNVIISGPIAGTGSSIAFNTGSISSTTSYNVNASKLGSGTALDFKAAGRVTITGLDISPSVIPVFTAEAWIKLTTSNGLQTVIGNDNGGYDRGMIVWNGEYHIFAGTDINTGIIPNINVWEHVAISWSASNIEMYVNGVNVFSTTGEINDPGPTDTYISGVYPVDGKIDEVRLWNTTRTLSQISSNMNTCLIGNEAGLIAYYKFENGIGSSILSDLTINGYNGTLSNMNVNTDWVTGTNVCGAGNCTIQMVNTPTITVNSLPAITVNSGAVCAGQSFTMVPTGASTYTYSNGSSVVTPTANATYTVTGTGANGCVNTIGDVSSVAVNNLPMVMASTNNTLLCSGQTATLSAMGTTSYLWSTTETSMDIAVSPTATTVYTVTGTDGLGCSTTITIQQDVSLCTGAVTLSNNNSLVSIYPNPTNGLFTIELTTVSQVLVTNALGQVVITETLEVGKHNLDILNQANGVYFVKVIENNKQQVIKLIKE